MLHRRIEIQPTQNNMARVEVYVKNQRTYMSETLSRGAAQNRAEALAGTASEIVDHTHAYRPVTHRPVMFRARH